MIRPRLHGQLIDAYRSLTRDERRILVIGDLHAPFTHQQYLQHCIDTFRRYNCNQVVFIGDIIDNHYASYHESDPDGMGGGQELEVAIKVVKEWAEAFPVADVCIGNHDRIVMRKAFSGAIPKAWIKSYNEVLATKWNWVESIVYDDVLYEHGEGGQAKTKAKNNLMSSVCGHTHTAAYCEWFVGKRYRIFGMQVGCGIDPDSYAAAYAKNFKRPALGCGVVIGGHTAINALMQL